MSNINNTKNFDDLWQEVYEELCALKCQVTGLGQDYLPDELQFGLHVQVMRLFKMHDQIFEAVKGVDNKEAVA